MTLQWVSLVWDCFHLVLMSFLFFQSNLDLPPHLTFFYTNDSKSTYTYIHCVSNTQVTLFHAGDTRFYGCPPSLVIGFISFLGFYVFGVLQLKSHLGKDTLGIIHNSESDLDLEWIC